MGWVRFKDKHPPFMKTVDVALKEMVCIAHRESLDNEDLALYSMELRRNVEDEATHWKERPKLPKRGQNGMD